MQALEPTLVHTGRWSVRANKMIGSTKRCDKEYFWCAHVVQWDDSRKLGSLDSAQQHGLSSSKFSKSENESILCLVSSSPQGCLSWNWGRANVNSKFDTTWILRSKQRRKAPSQHRGLKIGLGTNEKRSYMYIRYIIHRAKSFV